MHGAFRGQRVSGHQQEQLNLIDALSKGEVYNEGVYGAMSSHFRPRTTRHLLG